MDNNDKIINNNDRTYISSIEQFDSIVNNLNNSISRIKDIFNEEKNGANTIFNSSDVWKGKAQESAASKYNEMSSNYQSVTQTLENFVKFLSTASSSYKAFDNSVNRNIEDNLSSLNVN